ncbi:MAG TPA: hypothetical protein VJY39_17655 [Acidisphaera sp.]|nr:hypothetical protein [Acidisphaera sp.]
MTARIREFLDFSAEATAFTRFELLGTGQAEAYYAATEKVVGPVLGELLDAYARLEPGHGMDGRKAALRRGIFGHEKLGAIARKITKLWYIGIWYELPRAWTEAYGALPPNVDTMISGASYAEGLLWTAIGAHPPGAKPPGYGSWADPPAIPPFDTNGARETAPAEVIRRWPT